MGGRTPLGIHSSIILLNCCCQLDQEKLISENSESQLVLSISTSIPPDGMLAGVDSAASSFPFQCCERSFVV